MLYVNNVAILIHLVWLIINSFADRSLGCVGMFFEAACLAAVSLGDSFTCSD